MIIGLTGQIGSGKSAAAEILAGYGAGVISADQIGRDVVESSATLRRELVKQFGESVLTPKGQINRKKLANVAFETRESQSLLNSLVHPHLLKKLRLEIPRVERKHGVALIDAALLLNWEMDREVDLVLVIYATREVRFKRLSARGIDSSDAASRQRAQLPFCEYKKRADIVINNNGTVAQLRERLYRFWNNEVEKRRT
jgi:dephospho-CoA kinase